MGLRCGMDFRAATRGHALVAPLIIPKYPNSQKNEYFHLIVKQKGLVDYGKQQ
jgi:hypothetical protein